jgi:hypothetical protein
VAPGAIDLTRRCKSQRKKKKRIRVDSGGAESFEKPIKSDAVSCSRPCVAIFRVVYAAAYRQSTGPPRRLLTALRALGEDTTAVVDERNGQPKYAWESEGAEQDGEDIKAPNEGRQDERQQHRSYDAHVFGTGHMLPGFFRKKEMDKPGQQHA